MKTNPSHPRKTAPINPFTRLIPENALRRSGCCLIRSTSSFEQNSFLSHLAESIPLSEFKLLFYPKEFDNFHAESSKRREAFRYFRHDPDFTPPEQTIPASPPPIASEDQIIASILNLNRFLLSHSSKILPQILFIDIPIHSDHQSLFSKLIKLLAESHGVFIFYSMYLFKDSPPSSSSHSDFSLKLSSDFDPKHHNSDNEAYLLKVESIVENHHSINYFTFFPEFHYYQEA